MNLRLLPPLLSGSTLAPLTGQALSRRRTSCGEESGSGSVTPTPQTLSVCLDFLDLNSHGESSSSPPSNDEGPESAGSANRPSPPSPEAPSSMITRSPPRKSAGAEAAMSAAAELHAAAAAAVRDHLLMLDMVLRGSAQAVPSEAEGGPDGARFSLLAADAEKLYAGPVDLTLVEGLVGQVRSARMQIAA